MRANVSTKMIRASFFSVVTSIGAMLLLPCAHALARLGETAEQCVARYGQPVAVDRPNANMTFHSNGMIIVCCFTASEPTAKCDQINYTGLESFDVIDGLLDKNKQGSEFLKPTFRESETWGTVMEWRRKDGGNAEYFKGGGLFIRCAELVKAQEQAKQNRTNTKLNGL